MRSSRSRNIAVQSVAQSVEDELNRHLDIPVL